ncbi:MAG: vitamin K epoxide reductase family protein [Armatimonadota bacterium]|nr:vitamin K epoxide reductase family protein [Armatimonadota bacterium]
MPRGGADAATRADPGAVRHGARWVWPAAAVVAAAGAGISGYLTATALQGAPPVCLAGDCAAVAASPYAKFLGLPTATWGLGLYLVVGALAVAEWKGWHPAALPSAVLGLAAFGLTFSMYLLWVQIAVLRAVCSWCLASEVLWVVLLVLALIGALRAE